MTGERAIFMQYSQEEIAEMLHMVLGLGIPELLVIRKKLKMMGLELIDLTTFLDRREVILFNEQNQQIKRLKSELSTIKASLKNIGES